MWLHINAGIKIQTMLVKGATGVGKAGGKILPQKLWCVKFVWNPWNPAYDNCTCISISDFNFTVKSLIYDAPYPQI